MSITPSSAPRPQGSPMGERHSVANPVPAVTVATGNPPSKLPLVILIILCIVTVAGLAGSFLYSKRVSDQLNVRLDEVNKTLAASLSSQGKNLEKLSQRQEEAAALTTDLQGEFSQTKNRLGMTQSEVLKAQRMADELAKQQKQSAEQLSSQLGQLAQEQVTTKGAVGNLSTDVVGVKTEVKSTKDELAATRSQLQRVVGDLGVQSDLIAHSRADLDELRQRGERDYFEFDLRKSNRVQRLAGVQLELKKADPKRQRYTLTLVADDRTVEKKDKTAYEPVQFMQQGNRMPSEIVVNQIHKDRIVGYISVPKRKSDRVAMTPAS